MKTRQGFVSNSSSSSFILQGASGHVLTTADVARALIEIMETDWLAEDPDYGPTFNETRALHWLRRHPGYDGPIMFPWSYNYETYIWSTPDGVKVDTCNNSPWDRIEADGSIFMTYMDDIDGCPEDLLDLDTMEIQDKQFYHRELMKRLEESRRNQ
jgi:hypothetical protein